MSAPCHQSWQTWRWLHRFAGWGYSVGFIRGRSSSYNACRVHPVVHNFRFGRSGYLLGRQNEWWGCLIRRRHIFAPVEGSNWICAKCAPCPTCGSPDPAHNAATCDPSP